jgi:SAM-dependent methyltransferase
MHFKNVLTVLWLLIMLRLSCINPESRRTEGERFPERTPQEQMPEERTGANRGEEGSVQELVSNFEREVWQKPNMIISRMGDLHEKTVADIGAGYGYFAFRVLQSAKKVIAIDIDTSAIAFMQNLRGELPEDLQSKFEARLCLPDDPKLKNEEADMVIMVNTYIYIDNRIAYLKKMQEGMAKGGQLLIIDFKKKNIPIGPPPGSRIPLSQVEQELQEAGFGRIRSDDTSLEYQYIVTAIKR